MLKNIFFGSFFWLFSYSLLLLIVVDFRSRLLAFRWAGVSHLPLQSTVKEDNKIRFKSNNLLENRLVVNQSSLFWEEKKLTRLV
jgi:hypothetical protein